VKGKLPEPGVGCSLVAEVGAAEGLADDGPELLPLDPEPAAFPEEPLASTTTVPCMNGWIVQM
jgi:hypothetical protein